MKKSVWKNIGKELNGLEDVDRIAQRHSVPRGVVFAILQQEKIRDSKKNFGKVAASKKSIYRSYKKGETFVQIARRFHVPPLSVLWALRKRFGLRKSEVRAMIRSPEGNSRIAKETRRAIKADFLQSRWGLSFMTWKGRTGEKLTSMLIDVDHMTEDEIEDGRTPDFLLSEKMKFKGKEISWIESKATFADEKEFGYNYRKQLSDYVELFGPGAVIYWMGKIDSVDGDGVLVLSGREIEALLPPKGKRLFERLLQRVPKFTKRKG